VLVFLPILHNLQNPTHPRCSTIADRPCCRKR